MYADFVVHALGIALAGLAICGAIYTTVAAHAVEWLLRTTARSTESYPAVSILKPLKGAEPRLQENLRTFCRQDYPADVQIIFGVQDPGDPASKIVRDLAQDELSARPDFVADASEHGNNRKVSNLINMMSAAKHEVLIVSDSDIAVPTEWLRAVVSSLGEPGVGAVTCLYLGRPASGLWSQLSAMGITYHFLPNATFGAGFGMAHPCSGATIAFRRETLARMGGFKRFADELADDYEMGRAVRQLGLKIAIPPMLVMHTCAEQSFRQWFTHELRWTRTIRMIDPLGYLGSAVTQPIPLALLATLFMGFETISLAGLIAAFVSRLFLKWRMDTMVNESAGPAALLPVRDILWFAVFILSYMGTGVSWRGSQLDSKRRAALQS